MRNRIPPVWLWLNLLSLDAPLVALVWQDFLFRCYPTVLLRVGRAVLGLTVWAIYLVDRLLDQRRPAPNETIRHRFYRRHRHSLLALFACVVAVDVAICATGLRPYVLKNGILLAGGVLAYLLVFAAAGRGTVASKKPLAACLFTAGTFLIEWSNADHAAARLFWPAVAFGALCLANLLMIEHWSLEVSPRHRSDSYGWFCLTLLAVCLGLAWKSAGFSGWFAMIVLSAGGLYSLTRWGQRLSSDARCVLADAVLLAPLAFRSVQTVLPVAALHFQ